MIFVVVENPYVHWEACIRRTESGSLLIGSCSQVIWIFQDLQSDQPISLIFGGLIYLSVDSSNEEGS